MKHFFTGMLVMLAISTLVTAAEAPSGAGVITLKGETPSPGKYMLTVKVGASLPELGQPWALYVYSEPSHTLLSAMVDEAAPAGILAETQALNPVSTDILQILGTEGHIGIPSPAASETGIRVEALVADDKAGRLVVLADALMWDITEFEFTIQTPTGVGYKFCGYCGTLYCGCITCQFPSFTKCCPDCILVCGVITCP